MMAGTVTGHNLSGLWQSNSLSLREKEPISSTFLPLSLCRKRRAYSGLHLQIKEVR